MQTDRQILQLILQKIETLEHTNLNLERKIEEILKNTKRMEDHINFVEKTYDTVKTPFHYLMDKVNSLSFSPFKKSRITQNENDKLENKSDFKNEEYNKD